MGTLKRYLWAVVVGASVVGGIAYVGAEAQTQPSNVILAQDEQDPPNDEGGREPGKHRLGLRRAIRGEFIVPGEEDGTFWTVKTDNGLFGGVNGTTLSIKEDDGTTVEIPTSDDTRIKRDGERAALADLREGDHVKAVRADEGSGFVTKHVRAISPERWAQREQRREDCRDNPQQCRPRRSGAEPLTGRDGVSENVG